MSDRQSDDCIILNKIRFCIEFTEIIYAVITVMYAVTVLLMLKLSISSKYCEHPNFNKDFAITVLTI